MSQSLQDYSLAFAMPTMLSICLSSLNLSNTVPLTTSCFSCSIPFLTIPQHSITSGHILLVLEREGLLKVVQEKVCPWSKPAERNKPKWLTRPPNPMPFGIVSELKLTAHCKCKIVSNVNHLKELPQPKNKNTSQQFFRSQFGKADKMGEIIQLFQKKRKKWEKNWIIQPKSQD